MAIYFDHISTHKNKHKTYKSIYKHKKHVLLKRCNKNHKYFPSTKKSEPDSIQNHIIFIIKNQKNRESHGIGSDIVINTINSNDTFTIQDFSFNN